MSKVDLRIYLQGDASRNAKHFSRRNARRSADWRRCTSPSINKTKSPRIKSPRILTSKNTRRRSISGTKGWLTNIFVILPLLVLAIAAVFLARWGAFWGLTKRITKMSHGIINDTIHEIRILNFNCFSFKLVTQLHIRFIRSISGLKIQKIKLEVSTVLQKKLPQSFANKSPWLYES